MIRARKRFWQTKRGLLTQRFSEIKLFSSTGHVNQLQFIIIFGNFRLNFIGRLSQSQ